MEDSELIQQWNHYRDRLDFEIQKAEHQLAGVEARQKDLRRNLWIYIVFAVCPFILRKGAIRLSDWIAFAVMERGTDFGAYAVEQFAYMALVIVKYVMGPIAVLFLPICGYYWIRSVKKYRWHNRKDLQWELPRPRAALHEGRNVKAYNYYVERKKVTWILSRYYLYRSKTEEIYREITAHPAKLTLEQLEEELSQMEFYEEIRPAREKP
ncbi:MAG: hypothetical protein J1E62_06375 [Lachnospiraceae bacterium]|nr:hypothetical protein [Lachnospiraceae bacterium]